MNNEMLRFECLRMAMERYKSGKLTEYAEMLYQYVKYGPQDNAPKPKGGE